MTGPRIGPSAIGSDTMPISVPMFLPPAWRISTDCIRGIISPAPKPCTTRNAIRDPASQANEQATEPTRKTSSAAIQTRRLPNRSSAHATTGIEMASDSRYAVDTHWIVAICTGPVSASGHRTSAFLP